MDPLVLARSFIHLSGKHATIICDFVILVCLISCTNFISQDLAFVYKLDNIFLSRNGTGAEHRSRFRGLQDFQRASALRERARRTQRSPGASNGKARVMAGCSHTSSIVFRLASGGGLKQEESEGLAVRKFGVGGREGTLNTARGGPHPRPTRRTRAVNRGSLRIGSKQGCVLMYCRIFDFSLKA